MTVSAVWEGIYDDFPEDINDIGPGFLGDQWLESCRVEARERLSALDNPKPLSPLAVNRDSLLPFLVSVLRQQREHVHVLDFGGGLGSTYISLKAATPRPESVTYTIVEVAPLCSEGEAVFGDDEQIRFVSSLPPQSFPCDIVYYGSSMQYVWQWQRMIGDVCSYKPSYVLFSDLYAGDIPRKATLQNYYGSKLPMWMFNRSEFVAEFAGHGYDLAFNSTHIPRILGKEGPLPNGNLPEQYRLTHTCNLLFAARS